jgi:hypothetical protein
LLHGAIFWGFSEDGLSYIEGFKWLLVTLEFQSVLMPC